MKRYVKLLSIRRYQGASDDRRFADENLATKDYDYDKSIITSC